MQEISIVIPAAGVARRMRSLGPKALVQVGGEGLLARQLRVLRSAHPTAEIIVVLGHESETIACGLPGWVRVVHNPDYETTNTALSVGLGLKACRHSRVLVVYGDLVFNEEAIKLPITRSCVLVDSQGRFRDNEVGVNIINSHVNHFCYGLDTKWAQVVYLTGLHKTMFQTLALNPLRSKLFGYEILNKLVDMSPILAVEPGGMEIFEVDCPKDLRNAQKIPHFKLDRLAMCDTID